MENPLKLNEKTAVIFGPLNSTVQSLANQLTESGADVSFITSTEKESSSMASNLMDLRQVHSYRGRAAAIASPMDSEKAATEALSRTSELFGSVDIFIDANSSVRLATHSVGLAKSTDTSTDESRFEKTMFFTNAALSALRGRNRGRLIFILNDGPSFKEGPAVSDSKRSALKDLVKNQSLEFVNKQVTLNCISTGMTEEYLLEKFPGAKSLATAREELKPRLAHTKMVDSLDVANTVLFLASPLGNAITGQVIRVAHGL